MRSLSPRQSQVLALIGDGLTYGEIGVRLGISESAAKHHTDVLRQKLGVEKKRQLVPLAHQHARETT